MSLSELGDYVDVCCDAGIVCNFQLPEMIDPSSLPPLLRDQEMWMRLAPRLGHDAKQQRGNRTYPRGFTTLKCKKAFVNGGHPELSDTDVPSALLSAYASFICAALQYLTRCSPAGQT